jgi:hypothetical protein
VSIGQATRQAEAKAKKDENEGFTFKPKINRTSARMLHKQPDSQPKGMDKYLARVNASKALKAEIK